MIHRISKFLGIGLSLVASIAASLEALHLYDLIESHIPAWLRPMFKPEHTLILAGVGILMFFAERIEKGLHQRDPTLVPTQTANPNVTQIANPVIEASQKVEIHNYASSTTASQTPQHSWRERLEHNVEFLGASKIRTDLEAEINDDRSGVTAVKACFLNRSKPGIKIADFNYARARVVFKNRLGLEVADISKVVWLGQGTKDTLHIRANTKECILLATLLR